MILQKENSIKRLSAMERILDDSFNTGAVKIADYSAGLSSKELEISKNYASQRLNDFSSGRYLAKKLLSEMGCSVKGISKNNFGAPIWPMGFTGSISHCDDLCICAVSCSGKHRCVGLDIEKQGELDHEQCRIFMGEEEFDQIEAMPAGKRDFVFAIAFSVRESVYKCLNPVYGKWIDHKDAKIDVSSISEGKVDLTVAGYNDMGPLVCRYIEHYPYIITSAVLYGGFSPVKLNS